MIPNPTYCVAALGLTPVQLESVGLSLSLSVCVGGGGGVLITPLHYYYYYHYPKSQNHTPVIATPFCLDASRVPFKGG